MYFKYSPLADNLQKKVLIPNVTQNQKYRPQIVKTVTLVHNCALFALLPVIIAVSFCLRETRLAGRGREGMREGGRKYPTDWVCNESDSEEGGNVWKQPRVERDAQGIFAKSKMSSWMMASPRSRAWFLRQYWLSEKEKHQKLHAWQHDTTPNSESADFSH